MLQRRMPYVYDTAANGNLPPASLPPRPSGRLRGRRCQQRIRRRPVRPIPADRPQNLVVRADVDIRLACGTMISAGARCHLGNSIPAGLCNPPKDNSMFSHRPIVAGSLCVRQSVDPGSRGARRARVSLAPCKASYRPRWAFLMRVGLSAAVLLVGTVAYSRRAGKATHGYCYSRSCSFV